jgi:hypothetical protein
MLTRHRSQKFANANIRLFFPLCAAGAEVFQLTSWDESQGKGVDDFLVNEMRQDPTRTAVDIVKILLADAQPFIGSFSRSKIDLDAVESELGKVRLSTLYRDQPGMILPSRRSKS